MQTVSLAKTLILYVLCCFKCIYTMRKLAVIACFKQLQKTKQNTQGSTKPRRASTDPFKLIGLHWAFSQTTWLSIQTCSVTWNACSQPSSLLFSENSEVQLSLWGRGGHQREERGNCQGSLVPNPWCSRNHHNYLDLCKTYVFLRKSFINVECSGIFLISSQSLSMNWILIALFHLSLHRE